MKVKPTWQYLVGPALGLAVSVIEFLQRHLGEDEAHAGLQLVLDGAYILGRETDQKRKHSRQLLLAFSSDETPSHTSALSEYHLSEAN